MVEETVSSEVAARSGFSVTDVVLSLSDGPVGEDVAERASLSRKPLMLVSVMTILPESPGVKAKFVGLELIVKSLAEEGELGASGPA